MSFQKAVHPDFAEEAELAETSAALEGRIGTQENARLTSIGRERIVRLMASGRTPQAVAQAAGVCPLTVRKCLARFKAEGSAELQDRSARRKRLYRAASEAQVVALRRQRFTGEASTPAGSSSMSASMTPRASGVAFTNFVPVYRKLAAPLPSSRRPNDTTTGLRLPQSRRVAPPN